MGTTNTPEMNFLHTRLRVLTKPGEPKTAEIQLLRTRLRVLKNLRENTPGKALPIATPANRRGVPRPTPGETPPLSRPPPPPPGRRPFPLTTTARPPLPDTTASSRSASSRAPPASPSMSEGEFTLASCSVGWSSRSARTPRSSRSSAGTAASLSTLPAPSDGNNENRTTVTRARATLAAGSAATPFSASATRRVPRGRARRVLKPLVRLRQARPASTPGRSTQPLRLGRWRRPQRGR